MIQIHPNLHIGNEQDYEFQVKHQPEWFVVHACKEPYHRQLPGYSGRGAPKGHREYLLARRGNRLFLNLVDTEDPAYVSPEIINASLSFIHEAQMDQKPCLVHCNQGESRSPSIGLLYMASQNLISNSDLISAEQDFRTLYPAYNPKGGMRGFMLNNWARYNNH